MKAKKIRKLLTICCLSFFSILLPVAGISQQSVNQKMRIDRRRIIPNAIAPEVYADALSLKITLMNLPGAAIPASHWEVEYKVFFVAEQDFEKSMKELNKAGKGRDLRPEYFQSRILLAEGKYSKRNLPSLKERAFFQEGIVFRDKVPHEQQTSFCSIMTFYSVKVFDAKLKKDIYGSDVFIVPPFEADVNDRNVLSPRTDLFLNFFVAEDGSLYRSNTKSASESTEWKPN
ncbi:MAG TPA: hypothetical protein VJ875_13225 [Pyrinomonadaceae bacterium]|nr:hypothetical protein [Pyrinomonadaceae bacterium]